MNKLVSINMNNVDECLIAFKIEFFKDLENASESVAIDIGKKLYKIIKWVDEHQNDKIVPMWLFEDMKTIIMLLNNEKLNELNKELDQVIDNSIDKINNK